jgi:glyoxylase-like metal-dependent hydrolase (beta-lactamase superfamily II)
VTQLADLTEVRRARDGSNEVHDRLVRPLLDAGQLRVVEGDTSLTRDLRLVLAPGHTPGHQIVVAGDDRPVVLAGDVIVHPLQLADPGVAYLYETDNEQAARTRRDVSRWVVDHRAILAPSHFSQPFIHPSGAVL